MNRHWAALMIVPVGCGPAAVTAQECGNRVYGWTNAIGGVEDDWASTHISDAAGNVYVSGGFDDRVDFDPGKGRAKYTAHGQDDMFVAAYARDGEYLWSRRIGSYSGDVGALDMCLLGGNSLAYVGTYYLRVDFDPTDEKDRRRKGGSFVSVLGTNGSYKWTGTFGGPANRAWSVTTDNRGDLLIAGDFWGQIDLDPGKGKDKHKTPELQPDLFLVKLSSQGRFRWSLTLGGEPRGLRGMGRHCLATDGDGNIILTGFFWDRMDFDPGRREDIRESAGETDLFVVKFDPDGNRLWAATVGGPDYDGFSIGVATDRDDNIYYTSSFSGEVDLDPTEGVDLHGPGGMFITSLTPDGAYRWSQSVRGSAGVDLDISDDVITAVGVLRGEQDFDPGPREDLRASNGLEDVYITRYSSDGDYLNTDAFGGTLSEIPRSVVVDADNNTLLSGWYDSPRVDFNPGRGHDRQKNRGKTDMFLTKVICGSE